MTIFPCADYCNGHTAIYSRKLRILIFSFLEVTHFNLSGLICLLNGLQCRCSLGLGQHTRLSNNSRLIKHHAVRFHLGFHDTCSCYCPVSHTNWPLWLCAGQIDLQRVFIRKLLFLVSPSRQLQIARDSYWLRRWMSNRLRNLHCFDFWQRFNLPRWILRRFKRLYMSKLGVWQLLLPV
jgi:hypothetical protein